jgi:hypothetical protein
MGKKLAGGVSLFAGSCIFVLTGSQFIASVSATLRKTFICYNLANIFKSRMEMLTAETLYS